MLKNIILDWRTSEKDREQKFKYLKELHTSIMDLRDLKMLIQDSMVKSVCVDAEKCYIELNNEWQGIKLIVNELDYQEVPMSILGLGQYEERETNIVIKMLKNYIASQKYFTFLDIGANVGWYTLNVKKNFNNAEVYSFEPSPKTFNRLIKNLQLNNESIKQAVNIGFYDKNDQMDFFYYGDVSGASSFRNTQDRPNPKTISVDVKRLDDWVEETGIKQVDFIKCDVEGAELFIYGGGVKTLQQYTPVVFSEMLRKWSAKFGYTPNDIIKFFKNLGYRCFVIADEEKLRECPIVTENTVETNYFFLHEVRHTNIIGEMCGE